MVDVRGVVASWLIMLNEDIYVLIRIESLVALVTLMFLVMFMMDIFRYQLRSSAMTTIMKTVDPLSDHIVTYLLGAMNSTDFNNPLFPVWAVVLVSLRSSLGYLTGYGIVDHDRRLSQFVNLIQFVGAGVLATRSPEIARPLWSLWGILKLRSIYRYFAHSRAIKSFWHARSSELLPEYLRQHDQQFVSYLVYGETKQKINIQKPQYSVHLDVTHPESLITLGKIQECSGALVSCSSTYKDMSLAFSLSRLLRCRLEDVPLHPESFSSTRDLIISVVIGGDQHAGSSVGAEQAAVGRAFRILELELAFVREYFYTLYPVVFWRGLFSLSLSLLQSIATFAITLWLAVDIQRFYNLPEETDNDYYVSGLPEDEDNVVLRVGEYNIDVITTWVFMFFMMFKEVWEMVTYLLSNWTRLLLVCKYVRSQRWFLRSARLTENLTCSFFTSKLADPWHGHIDQYEFLQSCTYKPTLWKLAHTATLGKTPEKLDGRTGGGAIKIHECVKGAVLQEVRRHLITSRASHQLPGGSHNNGLAPYEWALRLQTCSHVILVWHIATSLCEVKLAQDNHIDLSSKPGFPRSVWSFLTKKLCACCSSSQAFLVDDNILQQGQHRANHHIANSLSRYCAYLLVFQPQLLPDGFIVPEVIFGKTLEYASNKLKGCGLPKCRYNKMMAIAQEAVVQDTEGGRLGMNIVQQGAVLAKDLINNENEQNRWEILARVWAKLLVHIAPNWNAEEHKYGLESGGEFLTLIWALLWHCGIEKSSLWHVENASSSNSQAPGETSTDTRYTQVVEDGRENPEEPELLYRGRRRRNAQTAPEVQAYRE